ncbi:ComF family protein [Azoarcus taiwanensis]|uniref:ComF family protein n=1 Tax=Azoarcus taiwanensis TaxID=666964 RepID=A0A972FBA1_9RHOO|nr:ComF family protein [Azoarcus taiwanensis]NMG02118.1 ComF family protein [Azoarcus taiwanensis]
MSLSLSNRVASFASAWVEALLPRVCFLCGGHGDGQRLCPACVAGLPEKPVAHCPVCALPSVDDIVCGRCQRDPPAFDATIALHLYVFPMDRMVQALKYRGDLSVAAYFGRELSNALPYPNYDLVVPMPLHVRRLRERGFNQAVEIARHLGRAHGLRLGSGTVRRVVDTPPQADLPWRERKANMRGAFACDTSLDGQRVLVIDDVMTTGASLDALARSLKAAGAAQVDNLVVARTPPPG